MAEKYFKSNDEFDELLSSGESDREEDVSTAENDMADEADEAETACALTDENVCELWERYNYFVNYPEHLKKKARHILSETYESEGEQVMDIFQALQIKPFFTEIASSTNECFLSIEMDCEYRFYEFYIIALKSQIHTEILKYFRKMLK